MQSTPALITAATELLKRFPAEKCKIPVEVSYRLRSPRGGRGLRSPGRSAARGSDRSDSCGKRESVFASFWRQFTQQE